MTEREITMLTTPEIPVLRILGENGKIVKGAKDPDYPKEDLLKMYKTMIKVRVVDERMFKLQRQGRVAFYMGTYGEEATHIGATYACKFEDWIFPQYREQGAAFMRGLSIFEYVSQMFGTKDDLNKARQMPMHWGSKALNLVTISSTLATQLPQSVGAAYAMKFKKQDAVALTFFGEGSTSEGDFHAACNFAGVLKAPVIFFCRNNGWAISTPIHKQTASNGIAVKALAYGIDGVRVDGNDIFAVIEATKSARKRALSGDGATIIEAMTYRLASHSTSDDPSVYRDAEKDDAPWRKKDPVIRLKKYLVDKGYWSDAEQAEWEKAVDEELMSAIKTAEKTPRPELDTLFEDIYDEVPWNLKEQKAELEEFLRKEGQL